MSILSTRAPHVRLYALCLCALAGLAAGSPKANATEHRTKAHHRRDTKLVEHDLIEAFSTDLQESLERFLIGRCSNGTAGPPSEQTPPARRSLLNNYVSRERDGAISCDKDEDYREMTGKFAALALSAHYIAKGMKQNEGRHFSLAVASVLSNTAKKITESAAFLAKKKEAKLLLKSKKLSKSQKKNILAKQKSAQAVKKKNSSRSMDITDKRKPYDAILNGAKLSP